MAKTDWKKGDVAVFAGYSDQNIAEADQLLHRGNRVRIHSVDKDGSIAAIIIGEDGNDTKEGDTVFNDEIMTVDEWQRVIDIEKGVVQPETVDPEVQADEEAAAAPNKGKKKSAPKKTQAKAAEQEDAEAAAAPAATGTIKASPRRPRRRRLSNRQHRPMTAQKCWKSRTPRPSRLCWPRRTRSKRPKELVARAEEYRVHARRRPLAYRPRRHPQASRLFGKRGFEDYIEKELGVKYRKARYLINIYDYFTALGIDETKLGQMGWSKAKELVGKATKENFDELVEFANNHTRDEWSSTFAPPT